MPLQLHKKVSSGVSQEHKGRAVHQIRIPPKHEDYV